MSNNNKVHPIIIPKKRRNITFRYDVASALSDATNTTARLIGQQQQQQKKNKKKKKKLRRLPHIFAKVLELPFRSTAHVSVHETPTSFRFSLPAEELGDVRMQVIEICPGVVKIVVRGADDDDDCELVMDLDESGMEMDLWRFRLPECTRPEMASAACVDGELVVVVPKREEEEEAFGDGDGNGAENWNGGRLVVVQ